jgi:hypothetical protein
MEPAAIEHEHTIGGSKRGDLAAVGEVKVEFAFLTSTTSFRPTPRHRIRWGISQSFGLTNGQNDMTLTSEHTPSRNYQRVSETGID